MESLEDDISRVRAEVESRHRCSEECVAPRRSEDTAELSDYATTSVVVVIEEQQEQTRTVLGIFAHLAVFAMLWYVPSIGLTLFNKWLFNSWQGQGFEYPLTATLTHMSANTLVSRLAIYVKKEPIPMIEWRIYMTTIVPIGIFTGLDISLSNVAFSMRNISVSIITIVKSCSPFFILLFSFALGLEKVRCNLIAVILIICAGTFCATSSSFEGSNDVGVGIFLILIGTLCAGARWAITQVMMQRGVAKMSPLVALYHTAPICAISLIPVVAFRELPELVESRFVTNPRIGIQTAGLLSVGVLMAFTLIVAEYCIIAKFSAVTMTLAGVIKELITIALGVYIMGDVLAPRVIVGAFVIILAVIYYAVIKQCARETDTRLDNEQTKDVPVSGDDNAPSRFELVPLEDAVHNSFQPHKCPEQPNRFRAKASNKIISVGRDFVSKVRSGAKTAQYCQIEDNADQG